MTDEDQNIGDLIERAEAAASTEWEQNFTADMRERYDRFGDRIIVSPKQMAALERIAERANSPRR